MTHEIAGIEAGVLARIGPVRAGADKPATAPGRDAAVGDKVELSDEARFLSQLFDLPEVRLALVHTVRGQIEDGTYLTEERITGAVGELLDDLESTE